MKESYIKQIANLLKLEAWQVENTLNLLTLNATIPFISRYRKEATGSLDETEIADISEHFKRLSELDKRREAIIRSIEEQDKMTDDLRRMLENADNMTLLEDLYLPFKPKKRTKASIAREKGLEPLADIILKQQVKDISHEAEKFLTDEVADNEAALQGARDIIAEKVNEDKRARDIIRNLFSNHAVLYSNIIKGREPDGIKYADYYDHNEPLKSCPSHRLLAIMRGEDEGLLKLKIEPEEEKAVQKLNYLFIKSTGDCAKELETAIKDSYKRLLRSSIETEFRTAAKEKADIEAIKVFAENLRQLLMSPPLGQLRVLAVDPGYRSGCKIVCLDAQGNLLHNETIFPHPPQNEKNMAVKKLITLVNSYKIEAIAIGNGTASRETELFIKNTRFDREVKVFVVSEAGASVYSASKTARDEFPDYDVTVRGAVSIGRRLMDPLAELVKIDPKAIGVGQYQHDVNQGKLKESLDLVVESCVNAVGVDLNTSSMHLLTYVSGLGPSLAKNITEYRKENGVFKTREDLKKVLRMGDKAFEQSAGFLRIRDGLNPLDNSSVHPESYHIVEKMAVDLGAEVNELLTSEELRKKINLNAYISEQTGLPTLNDIMKELEKPGRDPRTSIKIFEFSSDVHTIDDLKAGMVLPGIVTNITAFGAFVDIGIKENGLIHVSQMANRFIKNPSEVLKMHQHLKVKVLDVDTIRKRIQLTLKDME